MMKVKSKEAFNKLIKFSSYKRRFKNLLLLPALSLSIFLASNTNVQAEEVVDYGDADYKIAAVVNNTEQNTYDAIVNGFRNADTSIRFNAAEVPYNKVGDVIHKVLENNPDIAYYNGASISSTGVITVKYKLSPAVIRQQRQAVDQAVTKVLAEVIKPGMTDFDKVKAVHDYIVLNTEYDYDNFLKGLEDIPAPSFTVYGVLVNEIAVCEGYAKTMQLLLNRVGVETEYVSGPLKSGVGHAWNTVKIDGLTYYIDATFDDPVPNTPGYVGYEYFLIPQSKMALDRTWNVVDYDPATSVKYAYFNEMSNPKTVGDVYIYSDVKNNKLYRINKDGTGKKEINPNRAPYFEVVGEKIYFSNYSNGGYLHKMNIDGTGMQKLNNIHVTNLVVEGTNLKFTDNSTDKIAYLDISNDQALADKIAKEKADQLAKVEAERIAREQADQLAKDKAEQDLLAKEKAKADFEKLSKEEQRLQEDKKLPISTKAYKEFGSHKDVGIDRRWNVKFNQVIDFSSVHDENLQMFKEDGTRINVVYLLDSTGKNLEVLAPNGNYEVGNKYHLFIKGIKSVNGKVQKDAVRIDFTVK